MKPIFYLGSTQTIEGPSGSNGGYTHRTAEAAVRHAYEIMEADDSIDVKYVVQVIRVVRRVKPRPKFKVEVVR